MTKVAGRANAAARPSTAPQRGSLSPSPPTERRAFLAIRHAGRTWVEDLPAGRTFLVGAAPGADLRVPEAELTAGSGVPPASRFAFDGEQVQLAPDGVVFLNGKRHEGAAGLRLGDELVIGPVQLVVGISMGPDATSRRVVTHHEFRERVWEEVARAARSRRPTALAMVRARPGDGRPLAMKALETFRAGDVIGTYAGDELELLLPDTPKDAAELVVSRLAERAGVGPVEVGVAVFPDDGDGPERLLRGARDALDAPTPGRGARPDADARLPEVHSPVTKALVTELEALARGTAPVLMTGEASVGKSVFARLLHDLSRVPGPFVRVVCGTWGRDGGGAGLGGPGGPLARAQDGTLVLDEVTELDAGGQAALAEALGAAGEPGARIVATCHRSIPGLVARGAFDPALADLLTGGDEVRIPSLRERPEDILPLAERFAVEAGASRPTPRLSLGAVARLRSYPWFGNVLELRNAMERAVRVAPGDEILAEHLPSEVLPASSSEGKLREHVDGVERDAIVRALADANHNQTHAARRLGLSRRALIYKMEKYGLKPPPGARRGG